MTIPNHSVMTRGITILNFLCSTVYKISTFRSSFHIHEMVKWVVANKKIQMVPLRHYDR